MPTWRCRLGTKYGSPMKLLKPVSIMLLRLPILSPITGALIGTVVAYVALNVDMWFRKGTFGESLDSAAAFGAGAGLFYGGICGAPAFGPCTHAHPLRMIGYMGGFSLILGLVFASGGPWAARLVLLPAFGLDSFS